MSEIGGIESLFSDCIGELLSGDSITVLSHLDCVSEELSHSGKFASLDSV